MKYFLSSAWKLLERLIRFMLGGILKVFKIKLSEEQWQGLFQFVKFCLVGVSNTAISLAVYYIFVTINREWYRKRHGLCSQCAQFLFLEQQVCV